MLNNFGLKCFLCLFIWHQVIEEATGIVAVEVVASQPQFLVDKLVAGWDYVVEVTAVSAEGVSQPNVLHGYALNVAENKIRE